MKAFTFKVTREESRRYERDQVRWVRNKLADSEYHDNLVYNIRSVARRRGLTEEEFLLVLAWNALLSREGLLETLRGYSEDHATLALFNDAIKGMGAL